MYRTFDYIESYSLTVLRISALIWMGLVAAGLVLICARLLRNKSGAWLINVNMLVTLLVLVGCACLDFGQMAAAWNVRHAREVGGRGVQLDLCYLRELGPSALLPLLELETRPGLPAALRARALGERVHILRELTEGQADWHGWTLRGASRLAEAQRLVVEHRLPVSGGDYARCVLEPAIVSLPPPPATDFNAASATDENIAVPDTNAITPDGNAAAGPLTGNAAR
jgi:hypothetical protein